jgi:hypothetical protein
MSRYFAALVAVFLTLSVIAPALGATTGFVRGTINVEGKPAPGASVLLEGEGSRFQTKTDAKGDYVFPLVPYGSYRLTARANGVHEVQVLVNVASGQVARVNLDLSVNLKQSSSRITNRSSTASMASAITSTARRCRWRPRRTSPRSSTQR